MNRFKNLLLSLVSAQSVLWGSQFADFNTQEQNNIRSFYAIAAEKSNFYAQWPQDILREKISRIEQLTQGVLSDDINFTKILSLDIPFEEYDYEGTTTVYRSILPNLAESASMDKGIRTYILDRLMRDDGLQNITDTDGSNLLMLIARYSCRDSVMSGQKRIDEIGLSFFKNYLRRYPANLVMENKAGHTLLSAAISAMNDPALQLLNNLNPAQFSQRDQLLLKIIQNETIEAEQIPESINDQKIMMQVANAYQNEMVSNALFERYFSGDYDKIVKKLQDRMPINAPYWAMPVGLVRQGVVALLNSMRGNFIKQENIIEDEQGYLFYADGEQNVQLMLKDSYGNIGRILGRNYIQQKIEDQNETEYLATPMKFFTVPNDDLENISVLLSFPDTNERGDLILGCADVQVKIIGAKVYAQYIDGTSLMGNNYGHSLAKKMGDQIGFLDYGHGSNLIQGKDNRTYFIDTETDKNFPTNTARLDLKKCAQVKNTFYPEDFSRIVLHMKTTDFAQ